MVDSTRTGKGTVARAGQTATASTLPIICRYGVEMLYPRAPVRQGGHTGTGRAFRQGEQNAHHVLAEGGRKCRVGRAKDRRYVSGA